MFNNYGYNPYYPQQQRFQNVEQPNQPPMMTTYQPPIQLTKPTTLLGKAVESIDVVKATDIPFDGSVSYFPLADGTAIVTKQFQNDGTTKTTIYKPIKEEEKDLPKYATIEEVKKEINNIDLSELDDLKDELKEIRKELKSIKKSKEE